MYFFRKPTKSKNKCALLKNKHVIFNVFSNLETTSTKLNNLQRLELYVYI